MATPRGKRGPSKLETAGITRVGKLLEKKPPRTPQELKKFLSEVMTDVANGQILPNYATSISQLARQISMIDKMEGEALGDINQVDDSELEKQLKELGDDSIQD